MDKKEEKDVNPTIGEQEAQWYLEQLQKKQRYSMFLHNDASSAKESTDFLNNADFWFEE